MQARVHGGSVGWRVEQGVKTSCTRLVGVPSGWMRCQAQGRRADLRPNDLELDLATEC